MFQAMFWYRGFHLLRGIGDSIYARGGNNVLFINCLVYTGQFVGREDGVFCVVFDRTSCSRDPRGSRAREVIVSLDNILFWVDELLAQSSKGVVGDVHVGAPG